MTTHRLRFRVTREKALDTGTVVWGADPIDAPIAGGVSGETLAELREEVEAVKHFILDLPGDVPVAVEYIFELPGVSPEELATYRETISQLSRHLREAGLSDEDSTVLLGTPGVLAQFLARTA
ncbi:hypothetical protein GCM10023194_70890 [Planotetraspora phitsanulokensis]|uniref:Uncharacterized protein n=1 Tax=Planotetraspora phitsanulokensis TaxID=575192 RepID=A0A8J3UD11_9ACTN|nr:hypothetical protein [Planotetraspora phitsanulokensis]GII43228.1 hypothetical protein Pph01_82310 [Planotetraspora phitsanulokensis]